MRLAPLLLCLLPLGGCGSGEDRPAPPPPANTPPPPFVPPAGLTFEEPGLSLSDKRQIAALWVALPEKARRWPVSVHLRPRPGGEAWPYSTARSWYSGGWIMLHRDRWRLVNVAHEFGHAIHDRILTGEQKAEWAAWAKAHPKAMPTDYRGTPLPDLKPDVPAEQFCEVVAVWLVPGAGGYRPSPQAVAKVKGYLNGAP